MRFTTGVVLVLVFCVLAITVGGCSAAAKNPEDRLVGMWKHTALLDGGTGTSAIVEYVRQDDEQYPYRTGDYAFVFVSDTLMTKTPITEVEGTWVPTGGTVKEQEYRFIDDDTLFLADYGTFKRLSEADAAEARAENEEEAAAEE